MQIDRKEILGALEMIKAGVSSNTLVEQSNAVLFNKEHMMSFNGDIAVGVPFKTDFEGGIPEDEFEKLLKRMKGDKIDFEQKNGVLYFSCIISGTKNKPDNKVEGDFALLTEITIPDVKPDIKTWGKLPKDFCEAVNFCQFSTATDISRGILTSIKVEGTTVVSCDNYRATRFEMSKGVKKGEIIFVPYKVVKPLVEHNPVEFAEAKGWTHFKNEKGVLFSIRTVLGNYPTEAVEAFFDIEGHDVEFPKESQSALGVAEVMAEETPTGKGVEITVNNKFMTFKGEKKGVGQSGQQISMKGYKGPEIKFKVHPDFLSDVIDKSLKVTISENQMKFSGENFVSVLALRK